MTDKDALIEKMSRLLNDIYAYRNEPSKLMAVVKTRIPLCVEESNRSAGAPPDWTARTDEEVKAHRKAEAKYYSSLRRIEYYSSLRRIKYYSSLRRIDDSNMPFPELWGFHSGWDACLEWMKENK